MGLAACPPNDRRSNQSGGTWVDVKMNQGSCVQCVTGWATSPVVGQARPDAQAKGATGESAGRGRAIVTTSLDTTAPASVNEAGAVVSMERSKGLFIVSAT